MAEKSGEEQLDDALQVGDVISREICANLDHSYGPTMGVVVALARATIVFVKALKGTQEDAKNLVELLWDKTEVACQGEKK